MLGQSVRSVCWVSLLGQCIRFVHSFGVLDSVLDGLLVSLLVSVLASVIAQCVSQCNSSVQ